DSLVLGGRIPRSIVHDIAEAGDQSRISGVRLDQIGPAVTVAGRELIRRREPAIDPHVALPLILALDRPAKIVGSRAGTARRWKQRQDLTGNRRNPRLWNDAAGKQRAGERIRHRL